MTLTAAAAPASPEQIIVHALSVRALGSDSTGLGHWGKGSIVMHTPVKLAKQFLSHNNVTSLKILRTESLGVSVVFLKSNLRLLQSLA